MRTRPIDCRAEWADSPIYQADEKPGYPCRQCLQDAEIGDELLLVSYDPFNVETPYRSASPIFLHRERCEPPSDLTVLPAQLTIRQLSVRAFDENALMIDAAVIWGDDLATTLERFFGAEGCDHVHVHNATRGCWAVRVDRAGSRSGSDVRAVDAERLDDGSRERDELGASHLGSV